MGSVVVRSEEFDCMHDERLQRRMKRRNVSTRNLKVNSNGKGNIYEDTEVLKRSQKNAHDSDFDDEDYMKFYDGLVRGLFVAADAHLDLKFSQSKKNNGRYISSKCTESPMNAPKSNSCILLDDDLVDEDNMKFCKDLVGGLLVDSDYDAYVDIVSSLSKRKNGVSLTDNGNANVNPVNGFVENNVGGTGAVDGGCLDASLDVGDVDTRSIAGDTLPVPLADGIARTGENDIGNNGHLNNGIVGEEVWDYGNNADNGSLGDGADNNEDPHYMMFLDNYRPDGKSCILEIPLTNEITVTVRYPYQDVLESHGCHTEKPERDCTKSKNTVTRKMLKTDSRSGRMETRRDKLKEIVEAPRKLRDVPARERKASVVESKMKEDYVNPIYFRADALAGQRSGPEALGPTNCKRKPGRDCPKSKNTRTRKLLKIDSRSERMETRSVTLKERVEAPRKLRDVPAREMKASVIKSKMKEDYVNPISWRADGLAGKRPSQEVLGPTNCKRRCEMDMAQRILREVPSRERKVSAVESNLDMEIVDLTSFGANEGASKRPCSEGLGLTSLKHKHKVKLTMVNRRTENQRKSSVVPSAERKVLAVISEVKREYVGPASCRENVHAMKRPSQEAIDLNTCKRRRGGLAAERKFEKQSFNAVPCGANEHAIKKSSPRAPSSTNCKGRCEMNLDMVDPSYQFFLNSLKKDGGYAVFAPQSGKRGLYEEDDQSSSDSEVIIMDHDQLFDGRETPFVSSKAEPYVLKGENCWEKGVSGKFRGELMKVLEKPYSEREYKELWKTICHRGHVERDINLRSCSKRCPTQAIGKSYLDHHADLEAKIQSAKSDRLEILNLMRGFFFWLMNTSHCESGIFRPWLDPSCLKVRPRRDKEMSLTKLQ